MSGVRSGEGLLVNLMKSRKTVLIFIFLSFASLWGGLFIGNTLAPLAHASNPPLLQVWNSARHTNNITDTSLTPGSTFNVDVNITGAGPIGGFDITLNYAISPFSSLPISTNFANVFLSPGLFDGTHCSVLVARKEALGAPFYRVRVVAVVQGSCSDPSILAGTGTLFTVQFSVVGTNATSIDIQRTSLGQKNALVVGAAPNTQPIPNLQVSNAFFQNKAGTLPVAQFSYSPANPAVGDNVTLDATQSYVPGHQSDSDHGIKVLIWDFGDSEAKVRGDMATAGIVRHIFKISPTQPAVGYYSVRLVVSGADSQLPMRNETIVFISRVLVHDISVSLLTEQTQYHVGDKAQVRVFLTNKGTVDEHANLNVTYNVNNGTRILAQSLVSLPIAQLYLELNYTLQTVNLLPQVYTISANAQLVNATDSNPADNFASTSFTLLPPVLAHDVDVTNIYIYPLSVIVSGQPVQIQAEVKNEGTYNETVAVGFFYNSHLIANVTGLVIRAPSLFNSGYIYTTISWDTTGVAAGNYTLSSTVYLATDQSPSDDTLIGPVIRILPPPTLNLSPSSGTLGTKVTIQASGFLVPYGNCYLPPSGDEFLVTFDDQMLGFAFSRTGNFSFTFNVPHADLGVHTVKAVDLYCTGLTATARFQVIAPPGVPGKLHVSLDTGKIYFPGETAVFYIMFDSNGGTLSPDSMQFLLIKPDGTNTTLSATQLQPGLFKASYVISGSRSLGTYVLVVNARKAGLISGSSIVTFEVQPSWLQANGPQLVGTVGLVGMVATFGVAWQQGLIKRKQDD